MRRNQKGWEELRKKLQNADIPPPHSSWKQFHENMRNKDSWHYVGRKVRSYEHTPPNYIKQRIFYNGGTVVRYSPLPALLIGLLIGLLAGLLMTHKDNLYYHLSYNPDYINHAGVGNASGNVENLYSNSINEVEPTYREQEAIHRQLTSPKLYTLNQTNNQARDYSTPSGNSSFTNSHVGLSSEDVLGHKSQSVLYSGNSTGFDEMSPMPMLDINLDMNGQVSGRVVNKGIGLERDIRQTSSFPMVIEVHGGINLSKLAALSGSGFSNNVLPGFQTSLLIGIPIYKANVLYMALSKQHSRVNVNIEGREYYNHISNTSLELGGISSTGFVLNGKPFYVRYGLMWTQFFSKGEGSIVGAGYSPGGVLAIRQFNGTIGRNLIWGWEAGMSTLFKDVGSIDGIQIPVHFYVSTIFSFKM